MALKLGGPGHLSLGHNYIHKPVLALLSGLTSGLFRSLSYGSDHRTGACTDFFTFGTLRKPQVL